MARDLKEAIAEEEARELREADDLDERTNPKEYDPSDENTAPTISSGGGALEFVCPKCGKRVVGRHGRTPEHHGMEMIAVDREPVHKLVIGRFIEAIKTVAGVVHRKAPTAKTKAAAKRKRAEARRQAPRKTTKRAKRRPATRKRKAGVKKRR